jgi:hypothetical protein
VVQNFLVRVTQIGNRSPSVWKDHTKDTYRNSNLVLFTPGFIHVLLTRKMPAEITIKPAEITILNRLAFFYDTRPGSGC